LFECVPHFKKDPTSKGCLLTSPAAPHHSFGSSVVGDVGYHDGFHWMHPQCLSGKQFNNVADTYFNGSMEAPDYSLIPGFSELKSEDEVIFTEKFDVVRKKQIKYNLVHSTPKLKISTGVNFFKMVFLMMNQKIFSRLF
jgi:hypothetical protein